MVCVLMSTYNGERFIEEQLQSLLNQKEVDLQILVRDDGSTDHTISILNKWAEKGALSWYQGENLKPARSFMNLVKNAPEAEFYAFCDQDDIWLNDKLSSAVHALQNHSDIPALYYGQTQLVDTNKNLLPTEKISPLNTLHQAVINHLATGCTVVFNQKLRRLLLAYTPDYISMHDSWSLLVCLAVGGYVHFDSVPHIYYRQHSNNVVGMQRSFIKEWLNRFRRNYVGKECERSRVVHELLRGYQQQMREEDVCFLQNIEGYSQNWRKKYKLLFSNQIKPISLKYDILFRLSIILNRF